jgi:GFO/IDH/MocA oxidoreductase family protein
MSAVLRIGVVGGGLIAQTIHLPRIARLRERFELVAIVDPSETVREVLCSRYPSARPYSDWRRMLEVEAVDAIVICSPHATHAEVTLAALDAGVHVLVEKPLCINPVDARVICRRRDETGLVVQVGYMKRFDAGYESLLERLPPGRTDVRMIDVVTYDPSLPREPFVPARDLVVGRDVPRQALDAVTVAEREQVEAAVGLVHPDSVRTFSNTYLACLVHDINLVHGVLKHLGLAIPGTPVASNHWAAGKAANTFMHLSNGASWHSAWLLLEGLEEFRETVSFYFDDVVHELQFSAPYLVEHATVHRIVSADRSRHTSEIRQRIADSYLAQLEHFHSCIVDRSVCRNPPEDAALDIEVLRDLFLTHSEADRIQEALAGL